MPAGPVRLSRPYNSWPDGAGIARGITAGGCFLACIALYHACGFSPYQPAVSPPPNTVQLLDSPPSRQGR